jgi:hypothetical protein
VNQLRRTHKLKGRRERLRAQGWLTVQEVAALLKCRCGNVNGRIRALPPIKL